MTGAIGGPLVQSSMPRREKPCECPEARRQALGSRDGVTLPTILSALPTFFVSSLPRKQDQLPLSHVLFDLTFSEVLLWMSEEGTQRIIVEPMDLSVSSTVAL